MDSLSRRTQTEGTDPRRINRRSFPNVLELNLPSVDWHISAPPWGQGKFSAIDSDELSVFTPLETVQIAALDAIVPTWRISRRESVGSVGEWDRRSQSGPARRDTLREETGGDDESPPFNPSSAHQPRFSWQPDMALIFSIFLIALDMLRLFRLSQTISRAAQDVAWPRHRGVGAAGISCGSDAIVAFIAEPKTGVHWYTFGCLWDRQCPRRFWINLPVGVLPLVTIVFSFRHPEAAQPQDVTLRE
ncbi:hypothetical protein DL770_007717 [Monosporascus sp. CRB-9-2]|nr:hypothetical protein DL770_007717 [Monosporascus sp. CRB-9-2]